MSLESTNGTNVRLNPWIHIWFRPVKTLSMTLATRGDQYMHRLMMAWGTTTFAAVSAWRWAHHTPDPVELMLLLLLFGPILGILAKYILAAAVKNTSVWFGGQIPGEIVMKSIMAWSSLPAILGNIIFFCLVYFGFAETPNTWYLLLIMRGLFSVWTFVLGVKATAAYMQLNLPNTFVSFLLALILTIGPFTGLVLVYFFTLRGALHF